MTHISPLSLPAAKLKFIGRKTLSIPGVVVEPPVLGNTLVWLQQLEPRRIRQSGGIALLTCSREESMGGDSKDRKMWSRPGKWIGVSGGIQELIGQCVTVWCGNGTARIELIKDRIISLVAATNWPGSGLPGMMKAWVEGTLSWRDIYSAVLTYNDPHRHAPC